MAKDDGSDINPFTGKSHFDIVNDDKFLQESYSLKRIFWSNYSKLQQYLEHVIHLVAHFDLETYLHLKDMVHVLFKKNQQKGLWIVGDIS